MAHGALFCASFSPASNYSAGREVDASLLHSSVKSAAAIASCTPRAVVRASHT